MTLSSTEFNTVAHDCWSLPMPERLQGKNPGIDMTREFQNTNVFLFGEQNGTMLLKIFEGL